MTYIPNGDPRKTEGAGSKLNTPNSAENTQHSREGTMPVKGRHDEIDLHAAERLKEFMRDIFKEMRQRFSDFIRL